MIRPPLLVMVLVALVALLGTSSPAGANSSSGGVCRNGRYSSLGVKSAGGWPSKVKPNRLARVSITNPCDGYILAGWGINGTDRGRVLIIVAPGTTVDWRKSELKRLKLPRDYSWITNGNESTDIAAYRCSRPNYRLTIDTHGKARLAPYSMPHGAKSCPQ